MKNLSVFQLVIIGLGIVFLVVGTLIFAGILPGFRAPSGGAAGELVIWGTAPAASLEPIIVQFNKDNQNYFTLRYEEKRAAAIEREFVEAKADGRAPDLLLLPHDLGLTQQSRLSALPAESLPPRQFLDTFADIGGLFLSADGVRALPLVVDPLVLYYNKNLLAEAGLAAVPATWTEFLSRTAGLTVLDGRRNIARSAAALGETKNVKNFKDILAMLLLQAGNPIVASAGGGYTSQLNQSFGTTLKPAVAVLDFYTQFADPARANYSWNRSLPEARAAFGRGQTIFYFGYGSEYALLKRENPHLVFDVALVPQPVQSSGQAKLTLGRLLSVAAVRGGPKAAAAGQAAVAFAGSKSVSALSEVLFLPPARRDLLARPPADPALALFYRAALIARAWPDPDPAATQRIFENMVESVTTGRLRSTEAVAEGDRQLAALLESIYGQN